MPIIAGGSSMIWSRTIYTREIISCTDLTFEDVHSTIPYPLSDAANPVLNTTNKTIVGAINEVLAAVVAEDLWDRTGTVIHPHNAGDSVRSDSFIYTIGGGLPAGAIVNSLSMGHDPALHGSWIQSMGAANTTLTLNPNGGNTAVGASIIVTSNIVMLGASAQIAQNAVQYGAVTFRNHYQTDDCCFLFTGSDANIWGLCGNDNKAFNWQVPTQLTPTFVVFGDVAAVNHWAGFTHNDSDSKETIALGSKVTEHLNPVELADDASFDLPDATSGFGFFQVGDGEEYAQISWDSAGVVTLIVNSANVVNTDTDTNFCLFDNGTQVRVRNRLGAAKKVIFKYNHWTP